MPNTPITDSPAPACATARATARATAGPPGSTPRARLVWRDPVTGEDLELEIAANPELIESLAKAGFRPAVDTGEHEAA